MGVGACAREGTNVCSLFGFSTECSASPGNPGTEVCGDGIDQDCNGSDLACNSNNTGGCQEDNNEPNESSGAGTTLASGGTRNGTFCGPGSNHDDWFQLTGVSSGNTIRITTSSSSSGTYQLQLFDQAAMYKTGTTQASGGHTLNYTATASGTHFLQVLPQSSGPVNISYSITRN